MKRQSFAHRQRGIALPVMLILLAVMLVSSLYLLRASTSTTMTASNLAYDAALSKAADFGVLTGSDWLSQRAKLSKVDLNKSDASKGYVATFAPTQGVNDPAFWVGAVTVLDEQKNKVEYVIHRMCSLELAWDDVKNSCTQTSTNLAALKDGVQAGEDRASDAQAYLGVPQLHYVVTARISGPRGGNVVNQAVVMIGA